ncbi:MAG: uncharacterized protein PWQ82_1199 [Thermosediminibacterales bacterium]|nr:uncharacterized protein [Thermosediminibacterales bacterium]MDK2836217.1 uncharacterized protein [Thermosediminibacterales bacterium]
MKYIDKDNIEDIALGAALLGTGGGGDPYVGKLMALQAIEEHGPVPLLDPEDVPDDALIVPTAMMGAPTVLIEKIPSGEEIFRAFEGLKSYLNKDIYATVPIEAGGVNSMIPIAVAASLGLPLIDCDGMGRAFPELQMVTYHLYDISATPMMIADEKGNILMLKTIDNVWTERLARIATVEMGASVMISIYPMTGKELKKAAIRNIVTYSAKIGEAIRNSRNSSKSPVDACLEATGGIELFKGKIKDVSRKTEGGFARGEALLDGIDEYSGQNMKVQFQNENLIAIKNGKVVATVPDLICIVNLETAMPITTERLKYGNRVAVLGISCDAKWRTPRGIETVGPRYFGYDVDYVPVEKLAVK